MKKSNIARDYEVIRKTSTHRAKWGSTGQHAAYGSLEELEDMIRSGCEASGGFQRGGPGDLIILENPDFDHDFVTSIASAGSPDGTEEYLYTCEDGRLVTDPVDCLRRPAE